MFGKSEKNPVYAYQENEKTPLQDEKQEVIDNIIEEKTGDEPEPKVKTPVKRKTGSGRYKRKPKKKPAPKVIDQPYTEIQATNDANFITALIDEFRTGAGMPPIKDSHRAFMVPSAKSMFMKYGSSTSRWMPEIMFTGTLIFIGLDTVKEMRILKDREKPEKEPVKKPDLTGFKKIKPANKVKPSKEL